MRVLLNRGGRLIERRPERLAAQIRAVCECHGLAADLQILAGGELAAAAATALADALAGRLDAIVVGGGDGSVGTVAGKLAGSGVPLAVLPLGTLNHFAKDLGLAQDLESAVAAIAAGRTRAVDLGEVNGIVFVNNSALGVYPYMVADRERRRRRHGLGKWLAMTLALLRMLWRFPRRRLKLVSEGQTKPYRTPCLFVGVNEYTIATMTLRRTGVTDGRLWLFVATHRRPLPFLRFALRAAFSGIGRSGDFDLFQSDAVEVRSRASRLPVSHDGEVTLLRTPLRYRLRKAALTVFYPPVGAA